MADEDQGPSVRDYELVDRCFGRLGPDARYEEVMSRERRAHGVMLARRGREPIADREGTPL